MGTAVFHITNDFYFSLRSIEICKQHVDWSILVLFKSVSGDMVISVPMVDECKGKVIVKRGCPTVVAVALCRCVVTVSEEVHEFFIRNFFLYKLLLGVGNGHTGIQA